MFKNYRNSIDLLEALKIFLLKLENSKLNEAKLVENINNFDKNKYIDNNDDLDKNKQIEYYNSLKNENNRNTQKLFILFYERVLLNKSFFNSFEKIADKEIKDRFIKILNREDIKDYVTKDKLYKPFNNKEGCKDNSVYYSVIARRKKDIENLEMNSFFSLKIN